MVKSSATVRGVLRALLGYLILGAVALSLWLTWLAEHTTSTPIGLGLLHVAVLAGVCIVAVMLVLVESYHAVDTAHLTSAHTALLLGSAVTGVGAGVVALLLAMWAFLGDATGGFLRAVVLYQPAMITCLVALMAFAVWIGAMASVRRRAGSVEAE